MEYTLKGVEMKVSAIFFYILLLTLLILLFSTAVQATEYQKVNADEILKKIEKGQDVNITDCYVIGKLDVHTIKPKSVSNPFYNELLKSGYSKESLIIDGINENKSVIESNITIKDSFVKDGLDFSQTIFNAPIDLTGSTFNGSVNFNNVNFNSDINFGSTDYNSTVSFINTYFNSTSNFSKLNFNDKQSYVTFLCARFNGPVIFAGTNFNAVFSFQKATFNAPTYFGIYTKYKDQNTSSTIISGSTFSNHVYFTETTFNAPVYFIFSTFKEVLYLFGATFNDVVYFSHCTFNTSVDFEGPNKFKKIITSDEKTCNLFRIYYRNEARYEDADNIYYEYRKYSQDSKDLLSLSKWIDILSWLTCGYGLRPLRTLYTSGFFVGLFALLYWQGQGIYQSSEAKEKKWKVSGLDALLFSVREFTTLGSADWLPRNNYRILATIEGVLGYVMLAIFLATLTNVMIRS